MLGLPYRYNQAYRNNFKTLSYYFSHLAISLCFRSPLHLSEGVEGREGRRGNMKEKEIRLEKKKKIYQKPELVVHGSVEKITAQSLINKEGFKRGPLPSSLV
jgi:hypothetical protein